MILLKKSLAVIACGSENTTSDRDYTKVLPGVTKKMEAKPGRTDLAETTQKWADIVANIDQQEVADVRENSSSEIVEMSTEERGFELPEDLGGRRETLTPGQRDNALKALKSCGYNWFTAVSKFSDTAPQLLRDIRSVEIEYTDSLNKALLLNFNNVSEADFVTVLNNTTETVFGSETGTLFDTNYYTAHSILKDGVEITNPELKAKIDSKNATQALKKLAINMFHMADINSKSEITGIKTTIKGLKNEIKILKNRNTSFRAKISTLKDEITDLKTQIESGELDEGSLHKKEKELKSKTKELKETTTKNRTIAKKIRHKEKRIDGLKEKAREIRMESRKSSKAEMLSMAASITEGMPAAEASKITNEYANAWDQAEARETEIHDKKESIRAEIKAEIAELQSDIDSGDLDSGAIKVKEGRIGRLQQSISNDSELEMKAMNRLYESRLETAQSKFNEMAKIDERLTSLLASKGIGNAGTRLLLDAVHNADKLEIGQVLSLHTLDSGIEDFLTLNLENAVDQFQDALVESQISQMQALDFANEPYLSGNTVNSIVGGIQMNKAHESPENLASASEKFPILNDPVTWKDSMVENFGDFVKDEAHYHSSPDKFLFRGSKYLFRMAFSAQTTLTKLGDEDSDLKKQVDALTTMASALQDIRGTHALTMEKIENSLEIIQSSAGAIGLELPEGATPSEIVPLLHNLVKDIMIDVSTATMKGRK